MRLLMFAASLRKDSANKKLINLAKTLLPPKTEADLAQFHEFEMPLYNADIQEKGFPENTQKFIKRMQEANGIIISSPEYNFSTPGTLKNLIDWVSRVSPMPWKGTHILLMSASPSLVGGNRGLWHTRVPLECCGAHVYPDMFSLSDAYNAFKEDGQLKEAKLQTRLADNLKSFIEYIA